MTRLPSFSLMRPSWGTRRSAMLSWARILMREVSAAFILSGGLMIFEQRAVDAVAHPDLVLERLDVDVARAPLHRVDRECR